MAQLTKKQRSEKLLLYRDILNIAWGVMGANWDPNGENEFFTATMLAEIIPVLKVLFGRDGKDFLWDPFNLKHFETVDSITDFLFENGVRA